MAKPAHTSDALWNFYLKFKKKEKTVKLGGTFAPKPGYHSYRSRLSADDYSRQLAADKVGRSDICAAIDLTMPAAQMKKYSARLLASGKNRKDPRGNYLREFYGTVDGSKVTGWDYQRVGYASSDNSHLWHIHISILRRYAADAKAMDALYSILVGESVTAWRLRNGIKAVVAKVTRKPVPKPAPKLYYKARPGDTLGGIAAKHRLTLGQLLKLNPQKKKNPNALDVAEKIRVK